MIKLLTDMGVKEIALRFSELEGLDTIRNMAGRQSGCGWIASPGFRWIRTVIGN